MLISSRLLAVVALLLAVCSSASARPPHKKSLADHFGPFLPSHLNDCRICHLPEKPGMKFEEGEKPHNPFGARLDAVKAELRKAGKETGIPVRLETIAGEDSDGDGIANLVEILAGRNPGEKDDRPTESELVRAGRLQKAFQARTVYAWKPFEPVKRPDVPRLKNPGWARNPIDAFIAEQHEAYGLKPRPPAAPEILLRRVYLDLTGLPPPADEVKAFVKNPSAEAYEKAVDRLLNSTEYAERWARHWMDVWRYVDGGTSGLQDGWVGAPHMWRWRDWIIKSLDADKGYDRMVQEMLAGDEIAPEDNEVLAATAFLARNNNRSRDNWLHDIVNHTSRAFLGLTLECARCHDHKYDPLKQVEYYRLRAIFEPHGMRVDTLPGPAGDKKKNGLTRVFDERPTAPTYLFIRGVEQDPDKSTVLTPGVPEILGPGELKVEPVSLEIKPGKKFSSTGRRLAFARWLTRQDNPLAARVAVNHIWLRHTGQAILSTTFNFGADGQPPSHPALLDWLAAEFMAPTLPAPPSIGGVKPWSMKHLHRLIVTSATYQMTSTPDVDGLAFDPENLFFWRMPTRRMEAEVVRDSLLSIAGNLDPERFGPDIDPKRSPEVRRRSLYFRYTDSDFLRFLEFFDPPAVEDCYYRPQSILPQQALTLLNSDVALMQARHLARNLAKETSAESDFVHDAFWHVLSRPCTEKEEQVCLDYLEGQTRFFTENKGKVAGTTTETDLSRGSSGPALRARENLVHLLLNHHDFVTIR